MNNHQKQIEGYIEENKQPAIALLQKMVRQPSLQGNEAGVQAIVIEKLQELKLEVDQWDPPHAELIKHSYFIESRNSSRNPIRKNLVVHAK